MKKNKEKIIMLSGSFHEKWCWKYFIDLFEKEYDYEIEILEYKRTKGSSIEDYVKELERMINKDKKVIVNIISHSLGTVVAQRYIRVHPNRIKRCVFLSPVPPRGAWIEMIKAQLKMGKKSYSEVFFSNRIDEDEGRQYEKLFVEESNRVKTGLMKNSMPKRFDSTTKYLVVGSLNDLCMPLSSSIKTARYYKCQCFIFSRVCHDMMLDPEWKEVVKVIGEFWNRE